MIKMIGNRQGSHMAEAAVVLPIVILAVITLVLIIMFFYQQSIQQSRMHMVLRAEAGSLTGRMTCKTADFDGQIGKTREGIYPVVRGSLELSMGSSGLLKAPGRTEISDTWRITNGPKHVRRWK